MQKYLLEDYEMDGCETEQEESTFSEKETNPDCSEDTKDWENIEALENEINDMGIEGIRCAVHTLQSAVYDSMKEGSILKTISKVRYLVKKLKAPTMFHNLKKLNFHKPILDVATRWNSTYMLEFLYELKNFCMDMAPGNKDLYISESHWENISNIKNALKPVAECT